MNTQVLWMKFWIKIFLLLNEGKLVYTKQGLPIKSHQHTVGVSSSKSQIVSYIGTWNSSNWKSSLSVTVFQLVMCELVYYLLYHTYSDGRRVVILFTKWCTVSGRELFVYDFQIPSHYWKLIKSQLWNFNGYTLGNKKNWMFLSTNYIQLDYTLCPISW